MGKRAVFLTVVTPTIETIIVEIKSPPIVKKSGVPIINEISVPIISPTQTDNIIDFKIKEEF